MQDYRKLRVWQKAHRLTLDTSAISAHLQQPDAWPVKDQLFKAAISIPSNIAAGAGRSTEADFRRFLWHSLGSSNEVEYDLLLAKDLGFLPVRLHAGLTAQVEDVRRMLIRLMQSIGM